MTGEILDINPQSFLFAIRELGYSPQDSIADIVDNSVYQNAKNIYLRIYAASDNQAKYVSIMDDGNGMTEEELVNRAMPWGTEIKRIRDKEDLGKFGFGLKAASLAHCDLLTVISKKNDKVSFRKWDVDHINKSNSFQVIKDYTDDMKEHIERLNKLKSGTIVVWQKLEKLLDAETISRRYFHRPILAIREKTRKHLAMIFSEMMDKFKIHVNSVTGLNNVIEPWDPFLKDHADTIKPFPTTKIEYNGSLVQVTPYILPTRNDFNNNAEYEAAAGTTGNWFDRQGFYIYRKNRLIVPGGWMDVTQGNLPIEKREKFNRLRIKLSYDGEYDSDWRINLMKTKIRVPALVRNKLSNIVKELLKELQHLNYRRTPITDASGVKSPWVHINNYGSQTIKIDRSNPVIANVLNSDKEIKEKLEQILILLEKKFPDKNYSIENLQSSLNSEESAEKQKQKLETSIKLAIDLHSRGYESNEIMEKIFSLNNLVKNMKGSESE